MDKTDVNRICNIKEMVQKMSEIKSDVVDVLEDVQNLQQELSKVASNYSEMEVESERDKEENEDKIALLEEIIEKAESWDFGIKGWRTLETKQDLINAIKKEVLNV